MHCPCFLSGSIRRFNQFLVTLSDGANFDKVFLKRLKLGRDILSKVSFRRVLNFSTLHNLLGFNVPLLLKLQEFLKHTHFIRIAFGIEASTDSMKPFRVDSEQAIACHP